ncbi:Bromodomain and PHD finger-containing protein 1 [Lobaria immixta]|nr:Bromodomain and PHD finger-containing protein 1 [Lobaria immixta]
MHKSRTTELKLPNRSATVIIANKKHSRIEDQGDQVQGDQVLEELSSPTMIGSYNTGPFALEPLVDDATNQQTPEQPGQSRGFSLLLELQARQEEGEETNEEAGDEQNEEGEDFNEEGENSDKENKKPGEEAEESNEEGEIHSEEEEELAPLLEQGNEVGEMMMLMEANGSQATSLKMELSSPPPAPTERISIDRCTSPLCPVPSTIPHNRGLYLHNDQLNPYGENHIFGLSNPPPAVWFMIDRMRSGTEQPVDLSTVMAFRRNHVFRS